MFWIMWPQTAEEWQEFILFVLFTALVISTFLGVAFIVVMALLHKLRDLLRHWLGVKD